MHIIKCCNNIKKWWIKQSKKNKIILAVMACAFIASIAYSNIKEDEIEIPLSEAIILSQNNIFSEMSINSHADSSTLKLIVGDGINQDTVNIERNLISLEEDNEVMVEIGTLSIKELTELGFVLPKYYKNEDAVSDNIISNLSPTLLMIGAFMLLYYLYAGGYLGTGSRFKKSKVDIKLSDIGGISEIKDNIHDVINFLKDGSSYDSVGAIIPKGILLVGAPGTGKTMLAQAIATEANVPFYFIAGSEFHSMFVGLAGMRVKALFKKVSRTSGIIFIDEFDSIAHKRTMATGDASREWNHTLNQLLSELDGFKKNTRVLVLAATNRADVLDSAVLRPGRFDRKITIPLPNYKDRLEILYIHAKNKKLATDVSLENIAKQTSCFSGADIALLLNEAAILSANQQNTVISMSNIVKAIDKVLVGDERKSFVITDEEKKIIAYHEAGHAIVSSFISHGDKVERITILPHGNSGGFTRVGQEVETILLSKSKAMCSISVLLGGRVAEEVVGDITSGAQEDIKKANEIARNMVEQFGMGDKFGLKCSVVNTLGLNEMSIESRNSIEEDVSSILENCFNNAKEIINKNIEALNKLASELIENETLDSDDIKKIVGSEKGCLE